MENYDRIILPPHANPIVLKWLKEGKGEILSNGCWVRKMRVNAKFRMPSYPTFNVDGVYKLGHRVAINCPEGLTACHKCDNKECFNPSHIYAGTQSDNMKDKRGASILRKIETLQRRKAAAVLEFDTEIQRLHGQYKQFVMSQEKRARAR